MCIPTQGDGTFHVERIETRNVRRAVESGVSVRQRGEVTKYKKRMPLNQCIVLFERAGVATAGASAAVIACRVFLNDVPLAIRCGLLALSGIFYTLSGIGSAQGQIRQPVGSALRISLPDYYANQYGVAEGPKVSDDLVPGHTTTITRLNRPSMQSSRSADTSEDPVLHLSVQMDDHKTG